MLEQYVLGTTFNSVENYGFRKGNEMLAHQRG